MKLTHILALLAASALAVGVLAACGGGEGEAAEGTTGATTAATTADLEAFEEPGPGDPEAGAAVWEEAGCGNCHTLAAAGATGDVGPNLDEHYQLWDDIYDIVLHGIEDEGMPSFEGELTPTQIQNVAAFVVTNRPVPEAGVSEHEEEGETGTTG